LNPAGTFKQLLENIGFKLSRLTIVCLSTHSSLSNAYFSETDSSRNILGHNYCTVDGVRS